MYLVAYLPDRSAFDNLAVLPLGMSGEPDARLGLGLDLEIALGFLRLHTFDGNLVLHAKYPQESQLELVHQPDRAAR